MFIVVGLLYIIHMTPFPSQEMRGTTVQPGGNWLSLCQKIPSFLHQHICFASCLFSTWDRVTKHYNHNRKKRTFVKKGPKKDQKRTILAVWSLKGPSPKFRTFLQALIILRKCVSIFRETKWTSMQNLSNCIAASCNILMLLLALNCTYCAPSPFLYTLHSSQVMLWGRQRAERLPCSPLRPQWHREGAK